MFDSYLYKNNIHTVCNCKNLYLNSYGILLKFVLQNFSIWTNIKISPMKSIKWALVFFCFISIQTISLSTYSQDTIPGAQEQPAWVFPIYFEEGGGQKDTIYLGYDPNAEDLGAGGNDTIYGERRFKMDTSKFNVCWSGCDGWNDTIIKVIVLNDKIDNGFGIGFHKGKTPFTMRWDPLLFYSDSLPFPDLDPAPRVRGELSCSDFNPEYNNCPNNNHIVLTDTFPPYAYLREDTFYYDGDTNTYISTSFTIWIVPWDDPFLSIENHKADKEFFSIYPNPFVSTFNIRNDRNFEFEYNIYDMLGRNISYGNSKSNETSVNLERNPNGIYLLHIFTNENPYSFLNYKLLKTKP